MRGRGWWLLLRISRSADRICPSVPQNYGLISYGKCLSYFFLHLSDLLFVAYKITQSVQEGLTYLQLDDDATKENGKIKEQNILILYKL
jgi:hypothetical protein